MTVEQPRQAQAIGSAIRDDHADFPEDHPGTPGRLWRHASIRVAKLVLLGVVLYFVGTTVVRQLGSVSWGEMRWRPTYVLLALVSALAARAMIIPAYGLLLRPSAPGLTWRQIAPVSWIPALGRYVPGKVLTVAWAFSLLHRFGVPGPTAATAPFVLTGSTLLVGLTLAVPLTLWQPVYHQLPGAWIWCTLFLASGIVCLHPRVMTALGNFTLRKLGYRVRIRLPRTDQYVLVVIVIVGQFVPAGFALWLLARSLAEIAASWLPICISAVALSGTMGLLAIFAPAGIGVREGIMFIILTPMVGEGMAAVLVLAQRGLQTIAELLLAMLGWIMLHAMSSDHQ